MLSHRLKSRGISVVAVVAFLLLGNASPGAAFDCGILGKAGDAVRALRGDVRSLPHWGGYVLGTARSVERDPEVTGRAHIVEFQVAAGTVPDIGDSVTIHDPALFDSGGVGF